MFNFIWISRLRPRLLFKKSIFFSRVIFGENVDFWHIYYCQNHHQNIWEIPDVKIQGFVLLSVLWRKTVHLELTHFKLASWHPSFLSSGNQEDHTNGSNNHFDLTNCIINNAWKHRRKHIRKAKKKCDATWHQRVWH